MNFGCVIAFGFLANIATTGGLPPLVSQEDGFLCAYIINIIMAILMALAGPAGVHGGPSMYRKASFEKNSVPVVWPAVHRLLGGRHTTGRKVAVMGWALLPTLIILSVLHHTP